MDSMAMNHHGWDKDYVKDQFSNVKEEYDRFAITTWVMMTVFVIIVVVCPAIIACCICCRRNGRQGGQAGVVHQPAQPLQQELQQHPPTCPGHNGYKGYPAQPLQQTGGQGLLQYQPGGFNPDYNPGYNPDHNPDYNYPDYNGYYPAQQAQPVFGAQYGQQPPTYPGSSQPCLAFQGRQGETGETGETGE